MGNPVPSMALAALLVTLPVAAFAAYPECTSPPTNEEVEAAKGAFAAGRAAFEEADYERAITYWQDAYRRDCTAHDLLRNLARAYELSNQKEDAILALETYLERVPDTEKREQFQVRIEKLKEQIDKEAAAEAAPPPVPPPVQPPAASEPPSNPPPPPPAKKPKAPLFIAAGGAVVASAGAVGYLISTSQVKDFQDECGSDRKECPSTDVEADANSWRSRQIAFGAVTWVGVGVLGAGIGWYALAPRRSESVRVQPAIGPGIAGLSVSGRF